MSSRTNDKPSRRLVKLGRGAGEPAARPGRDGAREAKQPRKIHDFLADQLGSEIVGGAFPPGTLLPAEAELRKRFGVSRTALREAFRALNAKGLIVSRTKIGTRVRRKTDWNMLDPDVLAWHLKTAPNEDFITDLFELREMVEPAAAALAAAGRTDTTLAPIAAAYADMVRYKNGGTGELIQADLRFHQAILEATGNYFVGAFGSLIHAALIGSFELGWRGAATIEDDRLLQHRAVLDAIAAGKPNLARSRMAELLNDSIDDVRRSLRRQRQDNTSARTREASTPAGGAESLRKSGRAKTRVPGAPR
jgi:DNA-binding FadR family transcriptional regulator